jgi:predicted amidophosphoribosyltransferase
VAQHLRHKDALLNLQRLDRLDLLLGEHCYLDCSDECYFLCMYDCSHQRSLKSLVISLKQGEKSAIDMAADELLNALPWDWVNRFTFVPMPSSSGTWNPIRLLLSRLPRLDKRELLLQRQVTRRSCDGWRIPPLQRSNLLFLNESQAIPKPVTVVILDDVVTTGAHFRAAKLVVRKKWPCMRVIGLFLSRTCLTRLSCRGSLAS